MKNLIINLDLLSPKTSLFYKGNKRYFSWVGLLLSFLFMSILLGFALYFFVLFIQGKNISLIFSRDFKEVSVEGDISKKLLIYQIKDSYGKLADPRAVQTFPTLWILTNRDTQVFNLTDKLCTAEELDTEKYASFIDFNVSEYKCISKPKRDLLLKTSQIPYYTSYLNIYVSRCVNTTENNNHCLPNEEIDKIIKENNYYLYLETETVSIDNYSNKPLIAGIFSDQFHISDDYISVYKLYLRKTRYESDEGVLLNSIKVHEDFGIDSYAKSTELLSKDKEIYIRNTLLVLQLSFDVRFIDKYIRSYQKIQSYAANISGIASVGYFFVEMITLILCRGEIIMSIFEPEEKPKPMIKQPMQLKQVKESFSNFLSRNNYLREVSSISIRTSELRVSRRSPKLFEVVFYQCCKRRRISFCLLRFEEMMKKHLDVNNLINLSKQNEKFMFIAQNSSMNKMFSNPLWSFHQLSRTQSKNESAKFDKGLPNEGKMEKNVQYC